MVAVASGGLWAPPGNWLILLHSLYRSCKIVMRSFVRTIWKSSPGSTRPLKAFTNMSQTWTGMDSSMTA